MKCRRLLKPLVYAPAQVDGAVKTAVGETLAGDLTRTDNCAASRRTEPLLFFSDERLALLERLTSKVQPESPC